MNSQYVIQPKTSRGEETLKKIFNASEKLFREKGYHATSIIDIITLAKVSNGTFYNYFKDKISLFKYMLERYSHEIRRASSVASAQHEKRYDKEFYGFKAYIEYIIEHPGAYGIIAESMYVEPDLYRDYYDTFSYKYCRALQKGVDDGEVLPYDLTSASYILMGSASFFGLKYAIFDKKTEITDQELYKVFDIISNGLFTEKAKAESQVLKKLKKEEKSI